jgi:hypothetical protein
MQTAMIRLDAFLTSFSHDDRTKIFGIDELVSVLKYKAGNAELTYSKPVQYERAMLNSFTKTINVWEIGVIYCGASFVISISFDEENCTSNNEQDLCIEMHRLEWKKYVHYDQLIRYCTGVMDAIEYRFSDWPAEVLSDLHGKNISLYFKEDAGYVLYVYYTLSIDTSDFEIHVDTSFRASEPFIVYDLRLYDKTLSHRLLETRLDLQNKSELKRNIFDLINRLAK